MTRANIAGGACAALLVILFVATGCRDAEQDVDAAAATSTGAATRAESALPSGATTAARTPATPHEGLLYGRITMLDGDVYEGRLRWGGGEEALWNNYFNGFKDGNPWVAHVSPDRLPSERISIGAFGIELFGWDRPLELGRPFMARFGDIARIEARGRDLRVTLKSGATFELDRFSADDLADGLRVWDVERGVVDVGEWGIRTVELLPAPPLGTASYPLYGTVRTRHGDFTGLIQWDREECLGSDELDGRTPEGEISLRFDAIRSIARRSGGSALVTLLDGGEMVLSDTREVGQGNRGIYVDDPRYGRVLVSWDAFERVDFSPGATGPAWDDFPAGGPLTGSVATRSGRRLVGRLVYDLDESETTETLDAPWHGVAYTIPFELIASVARPDPEAPAAHQARVTLRSGEELELERAGDLGNGHAGMLIFVDGDRAPEYVPWKDVARVDFDGPPVM